MEDQLDRSSNGKNKFFLAPIRPYMIQLFTVYGIPIDPSKFILTILLTVQQFNNSLYHRLGHSKHIFVLLHKIQEFNHFFATQTIVALLGIVSNIVCTCIISVIGKRILWLISMAGTSLSCLALGEFCDESLWIFLIVQSKHFDLKEHTPTILYRPNGAHSTNMNRLQSKEISTTFRWFYFSHWHFSTTLALVRFHGFCWVKCFHSSKYLE